MPTILGPRVLLTVPLLVLRDCILGMLSWVLHPPMQYRCHDHINILYSAAALISYHKFCVMKQQKFINSQCCSSQVQFGSQ